MSAYWPNRGGNIRLDYPCLLCGTPLDNVYHCTARGRFSRRTFIGLSHDRNFQSLKRQYGVLYICKSNGICEGVLQSCVPVALGHAAKTCIYCPHVVSDLHLLAPGSQRGRLNAFFTHSLRVFLSTALPVATVHITASSRTRLLSAVLTTPSDTQPYTRRDNTCLAARGMLPCKCVAGETHNTPTPSLQVTMSNVVGRVYTTQRNTDK